jgi:hypothetical protein
MLWEKFDLEDPVKSLSDTDHFLDSTKPGVSIYKYVKLIPISLVPLWPILNKKRPAVKDWFIKPVAKSQTLSIGPIYRSVLRQTPSVVPPTASLVVSPIPPSVVPTLVPSSVLAV